MARRYTRREFLIDAGFALGSSVLLKVVAPGDRAHQETPVIATEQPAPTTAVTPPAHHNHQAG
jgi:hypothetical protein